MILTLRGAGMVIMRVVQGASTRAGLLRTGARSQAKQQAGEKGCGCSQHMAVQAAALGRRWGSTGGADGTHATAGLAGRSHIEHAALEAHRRGEHLRRTGGLQAAA